MKFLNKGFSLVEAIVYIAVFSIIFLALVTTVLVVNRSYGEIRVERTIDSNALSAYDRLSREIRNASDVDQADSLFNSSPGTLALFIGSGAEQIIRRFYLSDGAMAVSDNGVFQGHLTAKEASTTSLVFRLIAATSTKAVRIEMNISPISTTTSTTADTKFYGTFVLRSTYEH